MTQTAISDRPAADVRPLRERAPPPLGLVEPPTPGVKARQLLDEARRTSHEHLAALGAAIDTVRGLADAVTEGGELYGPGVRELARQLSEDLLWKSRTLQALSQRQWGG